MVLHVHGRTFRSLQSYWCCFIQVHPRSTKGSLLYFTTQQMVAAYKDSFTCLNVDFRLSKVEKCKSIIESPKPNKTSSKAISKLNLRELTDDQQEDFYRKLNLLKHQPVVLAVHHKYNDLSLYYQTITIVNLIVQNLLFLEYPLKTPTRSQTMML